MCGCKQKKIWSVNVRIDEDAMQEGYDGDLEPGTDTSNWVVYLLVSQATCTRCGEAESHDSLGACWIVDNRDAEKDLIEIVKWHGMVPKHVTEWDLDWEAY